MMRHLGPALAATLVLAAGAALARPDAPQAAPAQEPSAIERLTALEKQVGQLKAQLDAERKPSAKGDAVAGSEPVKELAELRRQMDQVLAYLEAQSQSAAQLKAALEDSRVKGFTYGINPDSRVVLLEGFDQFTTSLQTAVPGAKPAEPATGQARR